MSNPNRVNLQPVLQIPEDRPKGMKPFFFFDLDGPILDVSEKYYRVYRDIVASWSGEPLGKSKYWSAKREKTPVAEILRHSGLDHRTAEFSRLRLERIETPAYWAFDRVHPGVAENIRRLESRFRLVIVTLRGSRSELVAELDHFDLRRHFEAVLSGAAETDSRWKTKFDMVFGHLGALPPEGSWFIGDTDTDILAGKELGCRTIGVLSGIRSRKMLLEAGPDHIIPDVDSLRSVLPDP